MLVKLFTYITLLFVVVSCTNDAVISRVDATATIEQVRTFLQDIGVQNGMADITDDTDPYELTRITPSENMDNITDENVKKYIAALTKLQILELRGTPITDAALLYLKGLDKLTTLYLNDTKITDKGLEYLKALSSLKYLSLEATQITNQGLLHLQSVSKLEIITLSNNPQITDISALQDLPALTNLYLAGTKVADATAFHAHRADNNLSTVTIDGIVK